MAHGCPFSEGPLAGYGLKNSETSKKSTDQTDQKVQTLDDLNAGFKAVVIPCNTPMPGLLHMQAGVLSTEGHLTYQKKSIG